MRSEYDFNPIRLTGQKRTYYLGSLYDMSRKKCCCQKSYTTILELLEISNYKMDASSNSLKQENYIHFIYLVSFIYFSLVNLDVGRRWPYCPQTRIRLIRTFADSDHLMAHSDLYSGLFGPSYDWLIRTIYWLIRTFIQAYSVFYMTD